MLDPMSSFEVKNIIKIDVFGFDISITNSALFMLLVVGFICVLFAIGTKDKGIVPSKLQIIIEKLFFFTGGVVKGIIGNRAVEIFPYIISLFMFIMIGNIVGLFPFAFSFTSQLIVTLGMAIAVFIASVIIGFFNQGLRYFKHFCPEGVSIYMAPFFVIIELMSFVFRPISLGVRLFANMVAGHIMIKVIAGFAISLAGVTALSFFSLIPIAINVLLNVFKLVVCMLQAYVFIMLSCIYLSESLGESHS